jgi:hypothetical protein
MIKGESGPVKPSTLMALTRVLFLLALAGLCACTTVKLPQRYSGAESKIAIAPIEISGTYVPPSGWGMLIGGVGVVIEAEVTAPKRATLTQNIKEAWGDWRPEAVLRDKLAEELTKRGRIVVQEDEIIPLPQEIRAQLSPKSENLEAARLWYDPNITVFDHSVVTKRYSPMVIMEVGYGNFYIGKGWAIFAMLIKVVDPCTNNVIARKRAVARISMEKCDLKDPTQLQQFAADFKIRFDKAVAKAVPKMLDDIGL